MRGAIVTALILSTLLGVEEQGHQEAASRLFDSRPVVAAGATRGPCDEDRYDVKPRMGISTVQHKVAALIKCAVGRWSVPDGTAKAIAVGRCESSLWSWARSPSNGHWGVFQQAVRYWAGRVRTFLRPEWFWQLRDRNPLTIPSPFNARANVLVSIQQAHRGGWGPWSGCA